MQVFDWELLAGEVRHWLGDTNLRDAAEMCKPFGEISPSTLSRVQRGKEIDLPTLLVLCNAMKKRVADFIREEETGAEIPPVSVRLRCPNRGVLEAVTANLYQDAGATFETVVEIGGGYEVAGSIPPPLRFSVSSPVPAVEATKDTPE